MTIRARPLYMQAALISELEVARRQRDDADLRAATLEEEVRKTLYTRRDLPSGPSPDQHFALTLVPSASALGPLP